MFTFSILSSQQLIDVMTQEEFFNRYQYNPKTNLIGGGGFGKVYKAYDDILDRYVAIKVAEVKEGFEHLSLAAEVRLSKSLEVHKNIAYYEENHRFEMPNGEFDYGILQFYPEGNLTDIIQKKDLNIEQKNLIAEGIINGLAFLYKNKILHRDLKSSNILISKKENEYIPKITDFGLSKEVDSMENTAYTNSFVGGSVKYSAPEQLEAGKIKGNVDIWSLGIVLFELFNGKVPFNIEHIEGKTDYQRIESLKMLAKGTLPESINDIAEPFQEIVRGCLVVNPSQRYASIHEVKNIIYKHKAQFNLKNAVNDTTIILQKKEEKEVVPSIDIPARTNHSGRSRSSSLNSPKPLEKSSLFQWDKWTPHLINWKKWAPLGLILLFPILYFSFRSNLISIQKGKSFYLGTKNGDLLSSKAYDKILITYFGDISASVDDTIFTISKTGIEVGYKLIENKKPSPSISKSDSLLLAMQREEESFWTNSKSSNDLTKMEKFLQKYPESIHKEEAKELIKQYLEQFKNTNEASLWEFAEKSNSLSAYQLIIDKFRKGEFVDRARKKIKEIEDTNENNFWQGVKLKNNIPAYKSYLDAYPQGKYLNNAVSNITILQKQEEKDEYLKLKSVQDLQLMKRFISLYPNSIYKKEVNELIKKIEGEIREKVTRESDAKEKEANEKAIKELEQSKVNATPALPNPVVKELAPEPKEEVNEKKAEVAVPSVILDIEKKMSRVPGRSYDLGCLDKSKCPKESLPASKVNISSFHMLNIEVSQELFSQVMGTNPSEFKSCRKCPVENISYTDAIRFINKLNTLPGNPYKYRLPSEAEWEYAASGGTTDTDYSGSSEIEKVAIYKNNSMRSTEAVGSKKSNGFGLHDMSGNVYEWTETNYSGSQKVIRGGGWNSNSEKCNIKARMGAASSDANPYIGFRIVR